MQRSHRHNVSSSSLAVAFIRIHTYGKTLGIFCGLYESNSNWNFHYSITQPAISVTNGILVYSRYSPKLSDAQSGSGNKKSKVTKDYIACIQSLSREGEEREPRNEATYGCHVLLKSQSHEAIRTELQETKDRPRQDGLFLSHPPSSHPWTHYKHLLLPRTRNKRVLGFCFIMPTLPFFAQ